MSNKLLFVTLAQVLVNGLENAFIILNQCLLLCKHLDSHRTVRWLAQGIYFTHNIFTIYRFMPLAPSKKKSLAKNESQNPPKHAIIELWQNKVNAFSLSKAIP
jgi:hypothetical protein